MNQRTCIAIVLAACLGLSERLCAGEVQLNTGGRLIGQVRTIQRDGDRNIVYQVTTRAGSVVTVTHDQVKKAVVDSDETKAYQARAIATPDTVDGQLALAKWCQQHHLEDEYRLHLERVVELDPNHEEARQALSFRRVDGQWKTREQQMVDRGMVWYEGKYRTRQSIALLESHRKREILDAHWAKEIKRLRRMLTDRRQDRVQQATNSFRNLTEPLAAKPVVEILLKEKNVEIRQLLVRTASQIDHQATVNALVTLSLNDPDEEIRYQCLEALITAKRSGLTPLYVAALRSKENAVVNRAAAALAALGDTSAISPLIDALITEHKKVIGGNSSGGDTYSLSPSNGGFSFGGGGPQIKKFERRNPDVLTALVRLSDGQNFDYFKDQWRKWLATQAEMRAVDLRRDQ